MVAEGPSEGLRRLAMVAAAQPRPAAGAGVHCVRTRGWYLTSSQWLVGETLQHMDSRMQEVDRQLWRAEDGSGRLEERCDGRRSDLSGDYGPGHFDLPSLPSSASGAPARPAPRGLCQLRGLVELWSTRVVPPALQAALLDALAGQSWAVTLTAVNDRLGRDGVAVAAEENVLGMTSRYVVVLSAATGRLLAAEEVALDQADWLPALVPCTTSYTAFVTSALVDSLGSRPPADL